MSKPDAGKKFDALEAAQEAETTPEGAIVPPAPAQEPTKKLSTPPVVIPTANVERKGDPRKYKVLEDAVVSFSGNHTNLHAGDEISEMIYGPGTIARLREARVKLELVQDAKK